MQKNLNLIFQKNSQWKFVSLILSKCIKAGFQSVIAGGAVRDGLLGEIPKDFDIATEAEPQDIISLFPNSQLVGQSFGVIRVPIPNNQSIEVATFRKDGIYVDGRRPKNVEFCSIEEDSCRRDFTINALYYDFIKKNVIDFVGGVEDLDNKIIRTVGDANERFEEDKLRLLRAIRFAVTYGFDVEKKTFEALRKKTLGITQISKERIQEEIEKTLKQNKLSQCMDFYSKIGLLEVLFPEWPWREAQKTFYIRLWGVRENYPIFFWWILFFAPVLFIRFSKENNHVVLKKLETTLKNLKLPHRIVKKIRDFYSYYFEMIDPSYGLGKKLISISKFEGLKGIDFLLTFLQVLKSKESLMSISSIQELKKEYQNCLVEGKIPEAFISGADILNLGKDSGPEFKTLLDHFYEMQLEGKIKTRKEGLKKLQETLHL